jgi:type IV pilus assembly protein PilY1
MKTLRHYVGFIGLGILSGLAPPGYADDIELYLSNESSGTPTLLFMLDATGSMNYDIRYKEGTMAPTPGADGTVGTADDGEENIQGRKVGMSRLEALQDALIVTLNRVENARIGIGRFTADGYNSAILYPARYLDDPVDSEATAGETLAVMGDGMDDAAETVAGAVKVNEPIVQMTYAQGSDMTPGSKAEYLMESGITEFWCGSKSSGTVSTQSWNTIGRTGYGERLNALRFTNINIPQGKRILSASITFANNNTSTTTDARFNPFETYIHGIKQTSAGSFSTSNRFLSNLPSTDTSAFWYVESWGSQRDTLHTTPDLSAIVQEIVDQSTWTAGNAIAFKINRLGATYPDNAMGDQCGIDSTQANRNFDDTGDDRPVLEIVYEDASGTVGIGNQGNTVTTLTLESPGTDGSLNDTGESNVNIAMEYISSNTGDNDNPTGAVQVQHVRMGNAYGSRGASLVGMRYPSLPIPAGATVVDARLSYDVTNNAGDDNPVTVNIYAEDSVDPVPIKGYPWNASGWSSGSYSQPATFDLSTRTRLTDTDSNVMSIPWNIPQTNDTITTPNIAILIQTLIEKPEWQNGKGILFLFEHASGSGERKAVASDPNITDGPKLEITWFIPQAGGNQTVGLRFQDVLVPSGVTVNSAYLDFTSATSQTADASLTVKGESTGDAQPFDATILNGISGRTLTTASVNWVPGAWTAGTADDNTIVEVTSIVQEITGHADWCGGNAMGFNVSPESGEPLREFISADASPSQAPKLRVNFDVNTVSADACIRQEHTAKLNTYRDDAEERVTVNNTPDPNKTMYVNSADGLLQMGYTTDGGVERLIGFHFEDIPVRNGTLIEKAELFVTAATTSSDDAQIRIYGQLGDALRFEDFTAAQDDQGNTLKTSGGNISARDLTTNYILLDMLDANGSDPWTKAEDGNAVTITGGVWTRNETYTIDVTNVVQEIVNDVEWLSYRDIVLVAKSAPDNAGHRDVYPHEASTSKAAILKIQARGLLGPEDNPGFVQTVRTYLKQVVRDFQVTGGTPVLDALYEALMYFRGGPVFNGADRKGRRKNRVSHPASHEAGTQTSSIELHRYGASDYTAEEVGCDMEANPYDSVCDEEHLTESVNYISPIESGGCRTNALIILSDGITNNNNTKTKIRDFLRAEGWFDKRVSEATEYQSGYCKDYPNGHEECGRELADYMYNFDQRADISGSYVTVYSIGFALGKGWEFGSCPSGTYRDPNDSKLCLKNGIAVEDTSETAQNTQAKNFLEALALEGGGTFYVAEDPGELADVFENIIEGEIAKSANFVAPTVSTNAFDRLYHEDEIYMAMFHPIRTHRWAGNVKKYKMCLEDPDQASPSCALGEPLAQDGKPIVDSTATGLDKGKIRDDALDWWNDVTPADAIYEDDTGNPCTPPAENCECINCDGSTIEAGGAGRQMILLAETDNPPASAGPYTARKVYTNNGTTMHELIFDSSASPEVASPIDPGWFGFAADNTTDMNELVKWILGVDTQGERGDSNARWVMTDSLHARPVTITYGKDSNDESITKLLVPVNGGGIHLINAHDGKEQWMYIPQDMMMIQEDLRRNKAFSWKAPNARVYGIDGTPAMLVGDSNTNGIIEPGGGEYVYAFIGMRRGGSNYYALDLTPASTVTQQNTEIPPQLKWQIRGGTDTGFERLGQTWSRPVVAKVRFNGYADGRKVLLFGGGYDTDTQDASAESVTTIPAAYKSTARTRDSKKRTGWLGNAIYMVDPYTGDLLWWASNERSNAEGPDAVSGSGSGADLQLKGMDYSIPSDLTVVDANGDGFRERIYVGDTGGHVWRIDLGDDIGNTGDNNGGSIGGMLADLSPPSGESRDLRRFYHAPSVVALNDINYTDPGFSKFDLVVIGSGERPHPLETTVQNRLYALRDFAIADAPRQVDHDNDSSTPNLVIDGLYDLDGDGNAERDENGAGDPGFLTDDLNGTSDGDGHIYRFATITDAYMYDITDNILQLCDEANTVLSDAERTAQCGTDALNTARENINKARGWYLNLEDEGEKCLAKPIVIGGTAFFTTFIPMQTENEEECASGMTGRGRLYALDVLAGRAPLDFSDDGSGSGSGGSGSGSGGSGSGNDEGDDMNSLGKNNRSDDLGMGIASEPLPVTLPDGTRLVIGSGGSVAVKDPKVDMRPKRVYWVEE